MAGKSKYRPKSNGDKGKYLDYVARAKVKPAAVGESVVRVQTGGSRKPFDMFNPPNVIDIWEVNANIDTTPVGKKWCSVQNHLVDKSEFSPKKDAHDGLHPHCRECRNAHARRMYWLKKEADKHMPMAA